ncbi:MAG: hypothetical protein KatS3mg081_1354 [Gemmatimonadales bacterium]|nr:MAG: hypothetical protein KatS3mg081_1354 [Gemmatimonadales bacterium]
MLRRLAGLEEAIFQRYTLLRVLGQGASSIVYLAYDLELSRRVALKVLRPERSTDTGAERFLQEIRTAARLVHPNILEVYDAGVAGGFLYYVTRFVSGPSLRVRLNRLGTLGVREAVRIAADVGRGLSYAHHHGVIHRDVKPENILLDGAGALLADFGTALSLREPALPRRNTTTPGLFVSGTPEYMSPEQIAGFAVDPRTDMYSLACVLYEALAGRPPFGGHDARCVLASHFLRRPHPLRAFRPEVPEEICTALHRALSRDPDERFCTMDQFLLALG